MDTGTSFASNRVSGSERSNGSLSAGLADPWGEPAGGGAVTRDHDPDEVTIQIDALSPAAAGQDASDVPVFVDESGRRSRTFRRIGISVGIACAAYAVVIVVTLLSGNAAVPWLPVPVPGAGGDEKPASEVDPTRGPSATATPAAGQPGGTAPGTPGVTPSASGTASARPGATSGTGAATGSAAPSGAAAVRPSSSGTTRPSAAPGASASADPGPSNPVGGGDPPPPPVTTPPPDDPPSDSSPSPAGGAGDTVAAGPASPAPVASDGAGSGAGSAGTSEPAT
ncbi:hypothetical protein SAMN02745830_01570 [Streptomyces sp. Amel2xC10]|nr:hypothetical protein SAMN02745830_01570 [Streptomyces sp. Amel2xC10]